jgi:hypothetical protein
LENKTGKIFVFTILKNLISKIGSLVCGGVAPVPTTGNTKNAENESRNAKVIIVQMF